VIFGYIYGQKNKKARLFFFDVVLRGTPAKQNEYWTLVRPRRHPRSQGLFSFPQIPTGQSFVLREKFFATKQKLLIFLL
jgi:hypothetical protein